MAIVDFEVLGLPQDDAVKYGAAAVAALLLTIFAVFAIDKVYDNCYDPTVPQDEREAELKGSQMAHFVTTRENYSEANRMRAAVIMAREERAAIIPKAKDQEMRARSLPTFEPKRRAVSHSERAQSVPSKQMRDPDQISDISEEPMRQTTPGSTSGWHVHEPASMERSSSNSALKGSRIAFSEHESLNRRPSLAPSSDMHMSKTRSLNARRPNLEPRHPGFSRQASPGQFSQTWASNAARRPGTATTQSKPAAVGMTTKKPGEDMCLVSKHLGLTLRQSKLAGM